MPDPVVPATAPDGRHCAWCATPAADDATTCPSCGAALAQRESIGDLQIPGLTSIDPALEDYDKRPLHLRGPSASQGVAPALIVGAMAGGPIGLMAVGGVAAVAAAEYVASGRGGPGSAKLEDVGKPSEVLLQALEHLPGDGAEGAAAAKEAEPDHAEDEGGRSIWRDLPPSARRNGAEDNANGGSQGGS